MRKVEGVETVRVSLREGLTILDLRPGNAVTLARLRTIIKNNGFVSKEAQVVARGRPTSADGRRTFEVSGTSETLAPVAEPQKSDEGWKLIVRN